VPTDYAGAVLRWREDIEKHWGGLAQFDQAATVSTMLFACNRYLTFSHDDGSRPGERERILTVQDELQAWMRERGIVYVG